MSSEVVVAVVSSLASLVAAVIATWQAIKVAQLKGKADGLIEQTKLETQLALEKMKVDVDRRKRTFELAVQEFQAVEPLLTSVWQDMQLIKEKLNLLLHPQDPYPTHKDIEVLAHHLQETYIADGTRLPQQSKKALHVAKSAILRVVLLLYNEEENALDKESQGRSHRSRGWRTRLLKEARDELTESQSILIADKQLFLQTAMDRLIQVV